MCINLSTGQRCRELSNDSLHKEESFTIVLNPVEILYMMGKEILS